MKLFTSSALITFLTVFSWGNFLFSQNISPDEHGHSKAPLIFIENQNQWNPQVQFKTTFEGTNTLFIENQGFTFLLTDPKALEEIHDLHKNWQESKYGVDVRHHAYKVSFLNSNVSNGKGLGKKKGYYNYFLGDDSEKWSGHVGLFGKIQQAEIYDGITLETYSQKGHLKYDFIVKPNADISQIQLKYEGTDALRLEKGNLIIETSIYNLTEAAPIAWQIIDDKKRFVEIEYVLNKNILSYHFPNGYDSNFELIIDPTIIASTLSGTVNEANFGHSATFDTEGNIYTAGRSFGVGYPTTMGAFQQNYGGGGTDICISKYNPDGSDLIYATYLGGVDGDLPHSIIADFNQQLYIYGSSSSADYPTTDNAFQPDHGGLNDIIISVLTPDGSDLVGSTYVGGNANDGVNDSNLNANYGDAFRGEIILDNQNNIYVVSSSSSDDFPTTAGVFGPTKNDTGSFSSPAQDAVVIKASSDLSAAFWVTFLGGSFADIGNGIRVDDFKNVYVTGTAGDDDFPVTTGTYQDVWPGGDENAYIAKISPNGSTLLASTFYGSADGDEHSYFMDIDEDDNVHIYGQSNGTLPITPDTYFFNPGSPQFLASLDNDLTELVYSTTIGLGPNSLNDKDYVPVAFMVDKCNGIYFSGYYAEAGLPTTLEAISEEGDNFYLGVLSPDATELVFGTYYGDANHVDGGTSRFDKGGVVYQGVCSCTTAGIMDVLPNAWATTQSTFCDVGVFKIDFEIETVTANGIATPSTSGCAPYTVDFNYTGVNASNWEWSINDTIVSNQPGHTYTFEEAGSYEVQLIAVKPDACNIADTLIIPIDVLDGGSTRLDTAICANEDLFLDATTANANYFWHDGSTGATHIANEPGTYWVDIVIEGCTRRDTFTVENLSQLMIDLGPDTAFCDLPSLILDANNDGAVSFIWSDGSVNPTFEASETGSYSVMITDTSGCLSNAEINLVFGTTPDVELQPDTTLCAEEELTLTHNQTDVTFQWQDGSNDESLTVKESGTYWVEVDNEGCKDRDSIIVDYYPPLIPNAAGIDILCANDCNGQVTAIPEGGSGNGYIFNWETGDDMDLVENLCPEDYNVTVTDATGCTGIEIATVGAPPPLEFTMTLQHVECPYEGDGTIEVSTVDGGVPPYLYSIDEQEFGPVNGLAFLPGGNYQVVVQDANDCLTTQTAVITEPEGFVVDAGENIRIKLGEEINLNGQVFPAFGQEILWTPDDFLNCDNCLTPFLQPTETTEYLFTVTDPISGCLQKDSVLVIVDKPREVFIPNVFSPNGDGTNDFFTIFAGIGVEEVEDLKVFDRWGNLVFENQNFSPNMPAVGWDGHFKGQVMRPSVFAYFVNVRFLDGKRKMYEGSLTLLR